MNQTLSNSNEKNTEIQYQILNKVIYKRIFVADFQPTAVGKFMNNISGIYVLHFLPVQCLSNVMRSGLDEYNKNFRVLYLKLIMHAYKKEKRGKPSIFNAYNTLC